MVDSVYCMSWCLYIFCHLLHYLICWERYLEVHILDLVCLRDQIYVYCIVHVSVCSESFKQQQKTYDNIVKALYHTTYRIDMQEVQITDRLRILYG